MNITFGLLIVLAYFIARMLVKRTEKDPDRGPTDALAGTDRSSDRDLIEPID